MPNEKVLNKKKEIVKSLTESLKSSTSCILVDYKGINVEKDTELRKKLRESNIEYKVVKNRILKYALKESGYDELTPFLIENTAIAFSKEDAIMPAKILTEFSQKNSEIYKIKAGFIECKVLDKEDIIKIGNLPSKEQLIAQLLSVLTGNIRGLAFALKSIAEKSN